MSYASESRHAAFYLQYCFALVVGLTNGILAVRARKCSPEFGLITMSASAARSCLPVPRRSPRQYPWAPRMPWLATHWLISLLHVALVAELETYDADGQVGDWTGFDQVPT